MMGARLYGVLISAQPVRVALRIRCEERGTPMAERQPSLLPVGTCWAYCQLDDHAERGVSSGSRQGKTEDVDFCLFCFCQRGI